MYIDDNIVILQYFEKKSFYLGYLEKYYDVFIMINMHIIMR